MSEQDEFEDNQQKADEEVPYGSPFRDTIVDLRKDGLSWAEIIVRIENAYDMVNRQAQKGDDRNE